MRGGDKGDGGGGDEGTTKRKEENSRSSELWHVLIQRTLAQIFHRKLVCLH